MGTKPELGVPVLQGRWSRRGRVRVHELAVEPVDEGCLTRYSPGVVMDYGFKEYESSGIYIDAVI